MLFISVIKIILISTTICYAPYIKGTVLVPVFPPPKLLIPRNPDAEAFPERRTRGEIQEKAERIIRRLRLS